MSQKSQKTFKFFYTQLVIEWLDKHEYSRKHWRVVAQECIDKARDNPEATPVSLLTDALESFHYKYRQAVVKDFNLLADILVHAFEQVDWVQVAESRLMRSEESDSNG
tara:strand:+ start:2792 stop:3115 length:324 start_codon:yes stop_codon:yes gene_type:complete